MRSTITSLHLTTPLVVYLRKTDGATAWVGMPPQSLGFAPVAKLTWIRSPEQGTTVAVLRPGRAAHLRRQSASDGRTALHLDDHRVRRRVRGSTPRHAREAFVVELLDLGVVRDPGRDRRRRTRRLAAHPEPLAKRHRPGPPGGRRTAHEATLNCGAPGVDEPGSGGRKRVVSDRADAGAGQPEGAGNHALAAIADSLPDAVLVVDPLAQVRWANRAAERLFGLPADEAIGTNGLEFIHPDDLQLAALALTSVQSKEVGTPLELRVRSADGWRLVEMIGAPLGDDLLLSVRDLTERRRWEVAGDEVARFRSLMQNAASVTMLLTREGIVESSSGGLTRLLGLDPGVARRPAARRPRRRARPRRLATAIADVQPSPQPGSAGAGRRSTSGCGAGGTTRRSRAHVHEPARRSDRRRARRDRPRHQRPVAVESDLRAANSVLAATLESTADGILVVDGAGRITSFNSRFAEMRLPTGAISSRDDEMAIAVRVLEQLCDPEAFVAKVQELYAEPEAQSHDTLEFKDGRVFERTPATDRRRGRRTGVELPRRHRAPPAPGRAHAPGLPRPADRAWPTRRSSATASTTPRRGSNATAASSRCCSSTSTTSRP